MPHALAGSRFRSGSRLPAARFVSHLRRDSTSRGAFHDAFTGAAKVLLPVSGRRQQNLPEMIRGLMPRTLARPQQGCHASAGKAVVTVKARSECKSPSASLKAVRLGRAAIDVSELSVSGTGACPGRPSAADQPAFYGSNRHA